MHTDRRAAARYGDIPKMLSIWKVGCPHRGDIPSADLPKSFLNRLLELGLTGHVESFPAKNFHLEFKAAIDTARAPDLLVIGNYGILQGIETTFGEFTGIWAVVESRRLIFVTTSLDELKGPFGGWVLAVRGSANHDAVVRLATARPLRPVAWRPSHAPKLGIQQLQTTAQAAARAHLNREPSQLWPLLDPDHMVVHTPNDEEFAPSRKDVVVDVNVDAVWGNDVLAFGGLTYAWPSTSEQLGGGFALVAMRRSSRAESLWRVIFVSTDPLSIEQMSGPIPDLAAALTTHAHGVGTAPQITAPEDGCYPELKPGDVFEADEDERFGFFRWRRDPRIETVAELLEFTACEVPLSEPRVFILRKNLDCESGQFSAGWLWSTGCRWQWRIWSISADGSLAFSTWREFFQ